MLDELWLDDAATSRIPLLILAVGTTDSMVDEFAMFVAASLL
jgi:hypothetical protein